MQERIASLFGLALAVGLPLFALRAAAADKPGCADPTWAKQRLPGFEISDCGHKDWSPYEAETTDGTQHLEGLVDSVTYTLTDEKKDPTNDQARDHFVAEAMKAGAKLRSTPHEGFFATLSGKGPKGELWYFYTHGSGNDESTGSFTLTTVQPAPLKQEVVARATLSDWESPGGPCKNPPWLVKQFPYFKLDSCESRDFDQVTVELPEGQKVLAGHVYSVVYALTDEKKDPVAAAVFENYVRALEAIGAKLVSKRDEKFQAYLTRHTPKGDLWYLYRHASGNDDSTTSYELTYVAPAAELPKACTMRVYGVNFDFNKATLRPDSEPVLQQVLALFKDNPSFKAEIGGHTDDVGEKAYNQQLSKQRAEAVKAWLTAHGIDAARLTTAGYGDTQPVVPNSSDQNRARNRRVELKRVGCKAPSH